MTQCSLADKDISRQRLMQLLRRRKPEASSQTNSSAEMPLFDWTCPHHFGPQGWQMMKSLGKKIAACIESSLSQICLEAPKVTMKKVVQDFATVLKEKTLQQEKPQYFLPFSGQSKRPEGFLAIPSEAVGVLIAQLLRDPETAIGQNGIFSTLEESILQDAVVVMMEAILAAFGECGLTTLKEGEQVIRGDWPLEAGRLEDICGFTFTIVFSKQTIEVTMLALGEILDAALGTAPRVQKAFTAAELSRRIARQLHEAPVEITARLCESSISMEDLMVLEPGDVLVLGKKTTEPIETLLKGCSCFYAWPVASEGKLSLMVSQPGK
jgi:flagellar motor switch/type III secretory pathway protein FliN